MVLDRSVQSALAPSIWWQRAVPHLCLMRSDLLNVEQEVRQCRSRVFGWVTCQATAVLWFSMLVLAPSFPVVHDGQIQLTAVQT
jgi:hypothetical protein